MLFNEPKLLKLRSGFLYQLSFESFSALQRAEIAEIKIRFCTDTHHPIRFSALQRAEIAEIAILVRALLSRERFQCSSTSRNC